MRIIKSILMTGFNGLLLFVLLFTLGRPGDLYFNAGNEYFFSRGNASVSVRSEIMQQLHDFQDGYTGRDLSQAESFAARLFSPDDIVILGTMGTGSVEWDYDVDEVSIPRRALRAMESAATSSISSHNRLFSKNPTQLNQCRTMPKEIFIGHERAIQLVQSDWEYWGDCRFLMDNAQISASGPVAWFSTIGTVRMDGINLTLPLRLSGVLVKNDNAWEFQQLQFQFDLNLQWMFLVIALLIGWLIVNVLLVLFYVYRAVRKPPTRG